MSDIFISYKREEQPIARKLADAIQKKGWSVWWDPKLRAGEHFDDAIERALNEAKCVIVMWSKLSVKSRYVKDEATYALNRKKLVPIAIEEVDLPFRFEGIQTVQLFDWDGSANFPGYQKLVDDILSIIGAPPIVKDQGEAITKTYINSIGMEFVLIPSGSFMMGSKDNEEERPPHRVTISKLFYLQSTQVTQEQWKKVIGNNPSRFKDCGDNCPVEKVSWDDAQDFINKLNKMEGANNYRLPTEAEWEYACRTGTITDFFFGDYARKLGSYGWYSSNSRKKSHPVEQKKPNPWGLYDMHGNVWEWVEDDWHKNYKGAPSDGNSWIDTPRGSDRVMRGGSWVEFAWICRSAARNSHRPGYNSFDVGFRLASTVALAHEKLSDEREFELQKKYYQKYFGKSKQT